MFCIHLIQYKLEGKKGGRDEEKERERGGGGGERKR